MLSAFALSLAALAVAFSLGWHFGANDTDKKAYAAVWEAISTLPEPEQCALCGNGEGMQYHAPCLVDLSTGEMGMMNPGCFCRECRELLAGAGVEGYILVDLYDIDHIKAYSIQKGAVYTIRDYEAAVTYDRKNEELNIEVQGLLYRE